MLRLPLPLGACDAVLVGFSMGGGEVARDMSRQGDDDQIVPICAAGRAAAKGIAHATLIDCAGAPHAIPVTHRDRLTQELLAFIRGR